MRASVPISEHYTTAEAAALLHMKVESVVKKIERGQLAAVKAGKRWLIRKEIVDAMLQPQEAPQGT
jgi:excisionase family DNA binding protein